MMKIKFDVPEETKIKRRWVFWTLSLLLIISYIMFSIGYPFDRQISIAFVISFAVAWMLKIIEWVEHSKLVKS